MVDSLMNIEPDAPPNMPAAAGPSERAAQFLQVNTSLALDGIVVDEADLAIQQRIASGEITHDQAVAIYLKRAQGDAS